MTKYWDGVCVESLEPGMFLASRDYVEEFKACWWCEDCEDFKKGWFVSEFIGEDSEGLLVFKLYPTEGVGYPVVSYEGLHRNGAEGNLREILDLRMLDEENYN
jgi:hypothetical protein